MRKKVDSYLALLQNQENWFPAINLPACHKQKKLKLLILSGDLSENTVKKLSKLSKDNEIPLRIYGKSEELSKVTGCRERGVFGITDVNFADAILKEIDGE